MSEQGQNNERSRHSQEQLDADVAEIKRCALEISQKSPAMVKKKLAEELASLKESDVEYTLIKALYDHMLLEELEY